MDQRWQEYRGSGLSNAAGAAAAAASVALGALGIHEFTTADPHWVKLAAEILGSGVGGVGGTYLNYHLHGLPSLNPKRRRLLHLLRRKMVNDFDHSFVARAEDPYKALASANKILQAADVLPKTENLGSSLSIAVPSKRLTPQEKLDFERLLINTERITINCAALFPAALAVLLSLKERLSKHMVLDVDSSDQNSHDQFVRVSHKEAFDFVIAAEGPFFLVSQSGDDYGMIDRKGLKGYKRIFPCNIEFQHAFIKNGRTDLTAVHVFQTSSAELQYRTGFSDLYPRANQIKISNGSEIPFLAEAGALPPGECVLVWEPLAYLFLDNSTFTPVPKGKFHVWISLFCSKTWVGLNARPREAFRQLFVDEWRELNNPAGHSRALKLLETSPDILENFELSAGITKDRRLVD